MNRILTGTLIALAIPLTLVHVASLVVVLEPSEAWRVLLAAALGAVAVDGLTGLVHWACDTWGDEKTRWVGPGLIEGFREHHRDPNAMLSHDWIVVNREPALAATAALLGLLWPGVHGWLMAHPMAYAFVCSFAAYGAAANQLHRWAHEPHPPRWVAALQGAGLVLSPSRHARHHRAPSLSGYCISTGWLNPLLDRLGFWRWLERAIQRATGVAPRSALPAQRLE